MSEKDWITIFVGFSAMLVSICGVLIAVIVKEQLKSNVVEIDNAVDRDSIKKIISLPRNVLDDLNLPAIAEMNPDEMKWTGIEAGQTVYTRKLFHDEHV